MANVRARTVWMFGVRARTMPGRGRRCSAAANHQIAIFLEHFHRVLQRSSIADEPGPTGRPSATELRMFQGCAPLTSSLRTGFATRTARWRARSIHGGSASAIGSGLDAVELGVRAAARDQLVVTAELDQPCAVEHDDQICHPDG